MFISLFGHLVFLEKYHRIFICIFFVWLIGHKQVRNFSHNNFLLLFIWIHYLSWLTWKCVFLVFRAVRAMSESMRQNRLSRGQKDGSLGPSNDSMKHVCSIRLFMLWIIWKYISVVGRVLSLCAPIRLFDFHYSEILIRNDSCDLLFHTSLHAIGCPYFFLLFFLIV